MTPYCVDAVQRSNPLWGMHEIWFPHAGYDDRSSRVVFLGSILRACLFSEHRSASDLHTHNLPRSRPSYGPGTYIVLTGSGSCLVAGGGDISLCGPSLSLSCTRRSGSAGRFQGCSTRPRIDCRTPVNSLAGFLEPSPAVTWVFVGDPAQF